MAKKPYTAHFTVRDANLPEAEKALLNFVRALARAGARWVRAKALEGDWRKKPRKRVLRLPEELD